MGYGQILSGGTAGRYDIQLDYGEATRTATVAALEQQAAKLDSEIAKAYEKYQAAKIDYDAYMAEYGAALSAAIELLVAATALGNTAATVAAAEAIRARAQSAYDDANTAYVNAAAALTAAVNHETAMQAALTAAQADLAEATQMAAAATMAMHAAAALVASRVNVQAVKQAAASAAEQAYAEAVATGQGVEDARVHMELTQTALSVAVQDTEDARKASQLAAQQDLDKAQAMADAQAVVDTADGHFQAAQADVADKTPAAQLMAANRQLARGQLDEATAGVAAVMAAPSQESALQSAKQRVVGAQHVINQFRSSGGLAVQTLQLRYSTLKTARAQITDMLGRWNAAVLIETKPVWCVDFTENGNGEVATIDINGETDLTLIAPGCRKWRGGDGAVSTADKATAIARIQARQDRIAARLVAVTEEITAATGKEASLKAALDDVQARYRAAPQDERPLLGLQVTEAATAFQEQIRAVRALKARKVQLQSLEVEEAQKMARWQAKTASDTPDAGDGIMVASSIMSPQQSYLTRALLPGWQRHMPTYRWGTITKLDKDADTANVSLADATSSAQRLNINAVSSLANVPVVYMNCNARAFEEGDNVVVQFLGQDWGKPRVIGFVSDPKPCLLYTARYYIIGNGSYLQGNQYLLDTLERYKDEQWGAFSAPSPPTYYKFVQWSDGEQSLLRNDGAARESITRRAEYTFAPNFQLIYIWTIEAAATSGTYWDGAHYVKDWEVRIYGSREWAADYLFGPVCSTPVSGPFDQVVWAGKALSTVNGDEVLYDLTGQYLGNTSGPPGLQFPHYPSASVATVAFQFPGSDNLYSVTGSATENTFPGAEVPVISINMAGGTARARFTATSWSATYA